MVEVRSDQIPARRLHLPVADLIRDQAQLNGYSKGGRGMDETHHMTTSGPFCAGATTAPLMASIALIATAGSDNPPPR
jgi:hypothetical protein